MQNQTPDIGQLGGVDQLLYPALLILVRAGHTDEQIQTYYLDALKKAKAAPKQAKLFNLPAVEVTREVVAAWTTTPRYQTARGAPKVLPKEGEGSFQELVASVSERAASGEILGNLLALKNVRLTPAGRLRLISNFLLVKTPAELAYEPTLRFVSDACRAASSSLEDAHISDEQEKYWRAVELSGLTPQIENKFNKYTKKRTLQFLQELNEWLMAQRDSIPPKRKKECSRRVGLGIFFVSADQRKSSGG